MRILVTGSRSHPDPELVKTTIKAEMDNAGERHAQLYHGAARGADTHAVNAAEELKVEGYDFTILGFQANWEAYDKKAGRYRNQAMVDSSPDVVLAFPHGSSPGTWDCVRRARKAGLTVKVIKIQEGETLF